MRRQTVHISFITNHESANLDRLDRLHEKFDLQVRDVISTWDALDMFWTVNHREGELADFYLIRNDISTDTIDELIEIRSKRPSLRKRPLLIQNSPPSNSQNHQVNQIDRIHYVGKNLSEKNLRDVLISLRGIWFPEVSGQKAH